MAGDRIDVKAPSGHFFLDESTDCPIVLMAGGVGITPMISMIDRIIQTKSDRLVVLIYGVSDGADHPFKNYLKQASQAVENFHVVNCYAHPRAEDQAGVDYQVNGYASVELIKKLLPNNHCQFYMCGPPPFMKSLYNGLTEWLVPDERIFFEAFGPASIKRSSESGGDSAADVAADEALVTFTKSNKSGNWNTDYSSLLEMAEANNIEVESGCRAGSCGTCELGLLKGKVNYPPGQTPDCPPGACLPCIAKPAGPVELEA